ncbi:MAG: CinA family nicotinamide mononucleotide deamidase-related protein [Alphaproteobacteria bacterium]|nr:CinA family nicotinamide mononucleotide deamidase-related protein [Alphaproteobacteria bacterium]
MRIEIICTGDEILSGKTINTNYSHIARRLQEVGLGVEWGTTVGDDRRNLLDAFERAAARAQAVIVNGGLGPTVDDLSQEIAARAAGVELVLSADWFARMEEYYQRRGRVMPANNRKQAMLPEGAELLDNPIGTACGFAMRIGQARFFFTPGVPRELRRMLDEQVMPRLLVIGGGQRAIRLKRFHTFGLGESRVDEMLSGVERLAPEGLVKIGFQAHYPQLETKLAARGSDAGALAAALMPVEAEVRRRLGNFIVAEDDETMESVILDRLRHEGGSLALAETFTGGAIAARIAPLEAARGIFRRAIAALEVTELRAACGLGRAEDAATDARMAEAIAGALRETTGASHALAALVLLDEGNDGVEFGGDIFIGIASSAGTMGRSARMLGGRDWLRLGAGEMALDSLRRHLLGKPVDERIDFERR